MAELVNLRQKRKEAARVAARKQGHENTAKHGRTKAEKQLSDAQQCKAARDLDGHKRET